MKRIRSIDSAKVVFSAYFLFSILLSMAIITRFLFSTDITLNKFNVFMYILLFFVIPISSIFWLIYKGWRLKLLWTPAFLLLLVIYPITFNGFLTHEYLFLWFPLPIMMFLHAKWKTAEKGFNKGRTAILIASSLVIVVLLPNVTAYAFTNNLLSQAAAMSESDRASFISNRVFQMTAFGIEPRADTDYWKFLLTGAGRCKEMSIAGVNLMSATGLVARRIVFPGEDHALIEVKIDGTWLVADPGTSRGALVSRTDKGTQRIRRFGSLSYVTAYTDNGFIELTQQYVSTDTIVIRITRNGEPVAGVQVVLKHEFQGILTTLPTDDRTFQTDVDGNVTLHMGKLQYINEFKGSEEYYWIYVNGESTGYNVTSTGTSQVRLVEIHLD